MNDPDDAQVGVKANIIVHRVKIFIILPYCQHYSNYPCLPPYIGKIKTRNSITLVLLAIISFSKIQDTVALQSTSEV